MSSHWPSHVITNHHNITCHQLPQLGCCCLYKYSWAFLGHTCCQDGVGKGSGRVKTDTILHLLFCYLQVFHSVWPPQMQTEHNSSLAFVAIKNRQWRRMHLGRLTPASTLAGRQKLCWVHNEYTLLWYLGLTPKPLITSAIVLGINPLTTDDKYTMSICCYGIWD